MFRDWDMGVRDQDLGFRVQGSSLVVGAWGLVFRI